MDSITQMTYEAKLLSHCAPVFIWPGAGSTPDTIYANGTAGLIDTGEKKLLVTCAHVWNEYLRYRDEHPSAELAVIFIKGNGQPERITDDLLLDSDPDLDLAVFEARPDTWNMGLKQFDRITTWPIPRAKVGQPIAFLGFTGHGRRTTPKLGWFNYSFFGLSVSASSERRLMSAGPRGGRKVLDNEGKPVPPHALGGMSGSPAYVREKSGALSLAGFVQMGGTTDDSIFLTHACFLRPDGTLKR